MTSVDVAAQQKRINELALQDVDSLAEQQRQCAAELKALPDAIKEAAKAAEYKEAARLQERVDLLNRSATELAAARAMSVRAKRRRAPAARGRDGRSAPTRAGAENDDDGSPPLASRAMISWHRADGGWEGLAVASGTRR